jgi:hypothetical protein
MSIAFSDLEPRYRLVLHFFLELAILCSATMMGGKREQEHHATLPRHVSRPSLLAIIVTKCVTILLHQKEMLATFSIVHIRLGASKSLYQILWS